MPNFTIPVSNSNTKKRTERKYEFEPKKRDSDVVSPYDGVVINDNTYNSCSDKDQSFLIKHNVDGDIYYSVICNVIKDPDYITSSNSKFVSKGEQIGKTINNSSVLYTIVGSNGNKQDISKFINSENNIKDENGNIKFPSTSKTGDDVIKKWLLGVPKAALDVVKSGLSADKKREESKEEIKLSENIERIKSLLK